MPLFAQTADIVANPALGIMIFTLGGLAGAIFYLPFKKVTNWAWESYWMIYALVGLVIVPWVLAFSMSPNVISVLRGRTDPTIRLLFYVRGDVGHRRADLGSDDPLSRRGPGIGHRLRAVFCRRHDHSPLSSEKLFPACL